MSDEIVKEPEEEPDKSSAWMAQLPPKYNEDEEIKALGGFGALADAYKQRGEELGGIAKAPEKAEDYTFEAKGILQNETVKEAFLKVSHDAGMTQAQFEKMAPFAEKLVSAALGEEEKLVAKRFKESKNELEDEWGDKYETNLKLVARGVEKMGGAELSAHLKEINADNDPILVRVFYKIGAMISDDKLVDGKVARKETERTPYLTYS